MGGPERALDEGGVVTFDGEFDGREVRAVGIGVPDDDGAVGVGKEVELHPGRQVALVGPRFRDGERVGSAADLLEFARFGARVRSLAARVHQ